MISSKTQRRFKGNNKGNNKGNKNTNVVSQAGWGYKTPWVKIALWERCEKKYLWFDRRVETKTLNSPTMAADEGLIRVESGPILVVSSQPGLFGLHKQSQTTGKGLRKTSTNWPCFFVMVTDERMNKRKRGMRGIDGQSWDRRAGEQKSQRLLKPHTWTEMWLGIVALEHSDLFVTSIIYGRLIQ